MVSGPLARSATWKALVVAVESAARYTAYISAWGTMFYESYIRVEAVLALQMGMLENTLVLRDRSKFLGKPTLDPATDQVIQNSSGTVRTLKQCASFFFLAVVVAVAVYFTYLTCLVRQHWVEEGQLFGIPATGFLFQESMGSYLPIEYASVLTAGLQSIHVTIVATVGKAAAKFLNEWENYKTRSEFVDKLVWKIFTCEAIIHYNVFIYIAFVKASFVGCVELDDDGNSYVIKNPEGNCSYELQRQMRNIVAILFFKNASELLKPYLMHKLKLLLAGKKTAKSGKDSRRSAEEPQPSPTASQPEQESASQVVDGEEVAYPSFFVENTFNMPPYGDLEIDGTFEEFAEVAVMLGYATFFAAAFPLAPLLVGLLILIEMRVDSIKLFHLTQRPFPMHAETIGEWGRVVYLTSWVSLYSNACLATWTYDIFSLEGPLGFLGVPDSAFGRRTGFMGLCVLITSCKVYMAWAIPDVPETVEILKKRNGKVVERLRMLGTTKDLPPPRKLHADLDVEIAQSGDLWKPVDFGMLDGAAQRKLRKTKDTTNHHAAEGGTVAAAIGGVVAMA
jgi:hypothetical protein